MSAIKTLYTTRFVHKISPSPNDFGKDVELSESDLASKKTLGVALRKAGILMSGGQVREQRVEHSGRVVAFPSVPGLSTYWHSIILTPKGTDPSLPPGTSKG